jgi:hypothetical protein
MFARLEVGTFFIPAIDSISNSYNKVLQLIDSTYLSCIYYARLAGFEDHLPQVQHGVGRPIESSQVPP